MLFLALESSRVVSMRDGHGDVLPESTWGTIEVLT